MSECVGIMSIPPSASIVSWVISVFYIDLYVDREYCMASYLCKIHIPANREAMTKMRLSSHELLIERGRWLNILHKDRLCTLCNKLED